jgi:lysophospholipase L1-like esterase
VNSHPATSRLLLFVVALCCLPAVRLPAAEGPTPYPDDKDEKAWPGKGPIRKFGWMVDNRNYFWTQREKDQNAVVFVGDSLTGNWKSLKEHFPKLKVVNRGIGGDTSRGVLFRFKEDVLDLHPKAIVMCVGANDLSAHGDPAAVESNVRDMLKAAREQSPEMPFVLCLVPPRDSKEAPAKPGAYDDVNKRIKAIGEGQAHFAVVDTYSPFLDKDGKLIEECFAKDKLHLAEPGYAKWADALTPVFEKLGVKAE